VVIKTTGVDVDRIPIAEIACACMRGVEAHTCGGTLFERNGAPSLNCSPGFGGAMPCPADKACAPVHGPGNAGSGFVGCGDPGVIVEIVQDCNGMPGAPPFDPEVALIPSNIPIANNKASGLLSFSSAVGTVVGRCSGTTPDHGIDGEFCTADDPSFSRGVPTSILLTTKSAAASVLNVGDFEGDFGTVDTTGAPFTCEGSSIRVSGTNLAGAFTSCDQQTIDDSAVTVNFVCE
jgi:hypothetical protein